MKKLEIHHLVPFDMENNKKIISIDNTQLHLFISEHVVIYSNCDYINNEISVQVALGKLTHGNLAS